VGGGNHIAGRNDLGSTCGILSIVTVDWSDLGVLLELDRALFVDQLVVMHIDYSIYALIFVVYH
jgi:hypothetical protein